MKSLDALIATYNIRFDNERDGIDSWKNREHNVLTLLVEEKWDIIGLQEVKENQLAAFKKIANYEIVGEGRSTDENNEYCPIMYNDTRFVLVATETFWLSETPLTFSKGWDADCPRICTWAVLEERNSRHRIVVMNTHFDHKSKRARLESAKLLQRLIHKYDEEMPIILTGDFNANSEEQWYHEIANEGMHDTVSISNEPHKGPTGSCTGQGFNHDLPLSEYQNIDFIFVNSLVEVQMTETVTTVFEGRYPSDHLPVVAKLRFIR